MGRAGNILQAVCLAGAVALWTNCASTNVNPPQARARHGYVDFYSPGNSNLFWEVKQADSPSGTLKTVFSNLKPLPDSVVRLEFPPGSHHFELTFLNRVIEAPLPLEVQVQEGMVTPVKVELLPVGQAALAQREAQFGRNIRGVGRKSEYSSQAGTVERLVATVQPPTPYRPKQQTSYRP